jgi:hypothetical protein
MCMVEVLHFAADSGMLQSVSLLPFPACQNSVHVPLILHQKKAYWEKPSITNVSSMGGCFWAQVYTANTVVL